MWCFKQLFSTKNFSSNRAITANGNKALKLPVFQRAEMIAPL